MNKKGLDLIYLQTNLKHLRILYNLSYRQLGKESNVYFKNIYNLENGLTDIDKVAFGTIYRLCAYFNISLDNFVFKDLSQNEVLQGIQKGIKNE